MLVSYDGIAALHSKNECGRVGNQRYEFKWASFGNMEVFLGLVFRQPDTASSTDV